MFFFVFNAAAAAAVVVLVVVVVVVVGGFGGCFLTGLTAVFNESCWKHWCIDLCVRPVHCGFVTVRNDQQSRTIKILSGKFYFSTLIPKTCSKLIFDELLVNTCSNQSKQCQTCVATVDCES